MLVLLMVVSIGLQEKLGSIGLVRGAGFVVIIRSVV